VSPPSAVQSTPAVFATQWFGNQAIALAQLPSADFLRSFRLPAIQCSAVPEHCCQPIAHFSTLPVSYSPLSAQPLRPALQTADQSNSRQLPKQPIDCTQKSAHLVQAGECDQWYNGTLVFTSDQPAVTPWLSGGGMPSAHPDHVSQIAPTIPSAAPMGAGAPAPSLSLSLPTSIPWSVGSTRGPSHPYRVGRGQRPGGPSTVGPGDVSLPIPATLSVEAIPFLFPDLRWFSVPVSQVVSYRFACLRALLAAVGRGLVVNVLFLLAMHCNWFVAGCTLIMCALATLMFVSWDLARPKDHPDSFVDDCHDEEWEGPVFNLLHSCELHPHRVGRWVKGTKSVAEILPLPKLPSWWWYRRAKKVAQAKRALAAERSDAYYERNLIIIGMATVACLGGMYFVLPTPTHQPRVTLGCPVMVIAYFLGKVATILTGCGHAIVYHVGVPCIHTFISGVMVAPTVAVSCVRFLATTPVAVWHAAQPSLNVCHEQGMFAMAPGAHAFVCAWVQPKVWAVMGQLAIVLAPLRWSGAVHACRFMGHVLLGCSVPLGGGVQFAFPLLPSLGLSGVLGGMGALGGFDGLRPGKTLAPVWGGIVVGLSAGFAIVLRWAWERRPRARDLVGLGYLCFHIAFIPSSVVFCMSCIGRCVP
jgi:hypothetical protein